MKFRKKPIIVEAEEFCPDTGKIPEGVVHGTMLSVVQRGGQDIDAWYIWNERGQCYQRLEDGDWIIHGISGCRYPCKRDIFPQIYEAVEAAVGGSR